MLAEDRRSCPRFFLTIPVRFDDNTGGEVATQALNVSRSGLYLTSPRRLVVGSSLRMHLRVPTEISGSVFSELRCAGRVVYERECGPQGIGYGIQLEQASSGFLSSSNFRI